MLLWARLRPASALQRIQRAALRRKSALPAAQDEQASRETRWSATSVLRFSRSPFAAWLDAALTAAAAASADATMTALFANIKTESFDPDIGSTPAPTTLGFFNLFYQACVTGGDTYPLGRRFSNLYCQAVAPEFAAHEEEHGPMGTPNAPQPSPRPTPAPVVQPPGAGVPTYRPTPAPVVQPPGAGIPTYMPSSSPTFVPTKVPISAPTYVPTPAPITPSYKPTTAR